MFFSSAAVNATRSSTEGSGILSKTKAVALSKKTPIGAAFFRNPNYHLPSDTIDTLDFTFIAQLVKSLELTLLDLPPAPTNS